MAKTLPHNLENIYKTSLLNQILFGYVTAKLSDGCSIPEAVERMRDEFGLSEDDASKESLIYSFRRMRDMWNNTRRK